MFFIHLKIIPAWEDYYSVEDTFIILQKSNLQYVLQVKPNTIYSILQVRKWLKCLDFFNYKKDNNEMQFLKIP